MKKLFACMACLIMVGESLADTSLILKNIAPDGSVITLEDTKARRERDRLKTGAFFVSMGRAAK